MKTLHDILLERHRSAVPKLDAIRHEVIQELNNQGTKEQSRPASLVSSLLDCSNKLWLELVWPSRRIWAGLAAVWILILAANVSLHQNSPVIAKSGPSSEMMMALKDQQKILAELLTDRSAPRDVERQKSFSPKPRTETVKLLTV
jgi:hypothetical protein